MPKVILIALSMLLIVTATCRAAEKHQLPGNDQGLVQQLNRYGIKKEASHAARKGLSGTKPYLHSFRGETLGLGSDHSFHAYRENVDKRKTKHTRYRQLYKDIPVFAKEVVLHETASGTVVSINGDIVKGIEDDPDWALPLTPGYSAKEALAYAKNRKARMEGPVATSEPTAPGMDKGPSTGNHFLYRNEESELNIYLDANQKPRLVYYVTFYAEPAQPEAGEPTRPYMLIDAVTKEIVEEWDGLAHMEIGTGPGGNSKVGLYEYGANNDFLDVLENGGVCTMQTPNLMTINLNNGPDPGIPFSYSCPRNTVKVVNGAYSPLNDAHYFGGVYLNMFRDWYGILPLTIPLKMRVHFGQNYDNAFWDGSSMTFGDGYTKFYPLVGLDVVGHEVSHGFTEQNSGLIYSGESGGLNEAFSDMAGEAVKFYKRGSTDWKHDADIIKTAPALRYLDDPPADGLSIGDYKDYFSGLDVHYSSGVFNKAFYLLSTKPGWTLRKAFDVMVKANQDYWVPQSTFGTAACGAINAANDLSYSSYDVEEVFRSVSVYCGGPTISNPGSIVPPAEVLPNRASSINVGSPFSQTFIASGGSPSYTWSVDEGSLPPGLALNSQTGTISGTPTAGGVYRVVLQAADSQGRKGFYRFAVLVNEGLRNGWPLHTESWAYRGSLSLSYAPVITDLDGDGKKEIVVPDHNSLYVFHADGSSSVTSMGYTVTVTAPAVADIDGDGKKEIIVTGMLLDSSVYAFHPDLTPVTGFPTAPAAVGGGYASSPVVADLDNDGITEIAFVYSPRYSNQSDYGKNIVIVVDGQGNTVPGWPQTFGKYGYSIGRDATPAAGDLYRDGKKELVFATADGNVRIFSGNGTVLNQWVFSPDDVQYVSSAVLADMDGDGFLDIIVSYEANGAYTMKIFSRSGELLPGWPQTLKNARSNPIVADIDGDGRGEVIFTGYVQESVGYGELNALRGDGTSLPGWPARLPQNCKTQVGSPALTVADINGDGRQEVVLAAFRAEPNYVYYSDLYAFDSQGAPVPGFHKNASPNTIIATSAAIADLDNNGRQDLVVKTEDGRLYGWEMPQTGGNAPPQWPMFRNSESNSGTWDTPAATTTAVPAAGTFFAPQAVTLTSSGPATIYYTTDGSKPTIASAIYTAPISISATTTLRYFSRDSAGRVEEPKMGAYVIDPTPVAVISGTPYSPTSDTGARLVIGGANVAAYKYSLDAATYSMEIPVATPIALNSLAEGSHTVAVVAKSPAGNWQTAATTTTWTVTQYMVAIPSYGNFRTIRSAYSFAGDFLGNGYTIGLKTGSLAETMIFSRDLKVKLLGGYNPATGSSQGDTILYGSIKIKDGKVSISNVRLLPPLY